jgi:hypothetical protein
MGDEYTSKLVKGVGYQIFVNGSDIPMSSTEVIYRLNALERLVDEKNEKLEQIKKILDFPLMFEMTNEGLLSLIEKIILVITNEHS